MKKLIVFLILVFVNLCGFARNNVPPTTDEVLGDTMVISNTSVCNGVTKTLTIPSFLGFQTSCSYSCNGVTYYTTNPQIILTFNVQNDTTFMCYIDSINGVALGTIMAISISVKCPPTISIPPDSIHHVTCPDGLDYPYADGRFSVILDGSTENYSWINVESDSSYFFTQTYYDNFTVTNLRSGMYKIIAHGNNGCIYTDSVTINQPSPWEDNITLPEYVIDTIRCNQPAYVNIAIGGGTGPFSFEWWYELDSTIVFPNSATQYFPLPGTYYAHIYDSIGCAFMGYNTCALVIYEIVVDTIHMIPIDATICADEEIILSAYSRGFGNHTWSVGEYSDSTNYYTGIDPDLGFVSMYFIDTLTQSQYVTVSFSDENGCVTHDSVWIQIQHPEIMSNVPSSLCSNADYPINLSSYVSGYPQGGYLSFEGQGLSWNGNFSPVSSGSYTIYMNYTDTMGCLAQDTTTIDIMDPDSIILEVDTIMFIDSLYYIIAPQGGVMTINGIIIPEVGGQYTVDLNQFSQGYYTLHFEIIQGDYDCLSEYETIIHVVDRTSITDFDQDVSIYPNPATTVLNLSSTEMMDFTICITDIAGRVIMREKILDSFYTVDVSNLTSGIYLLRLETPEGATKSIKFIKH